MPFEDEEAPLSKVVSNLKINNDNSSVRVADAEKIPFDKRANEAFSQDESFKKKAYDLGKVFVQILDDKTLVANKSLMAKDLERESLQNLIKLGMEMNADENQPESMGSIGMITLLLKGVIMQRDKINSLEYRVLGLEKKIFDFEINSRVDATSHSIKE